MLAFHRSGDCGSHRRVKIPGALLRDRGCVKTLLHGLERRHLDTLGFALPVLHARKISCQAGCITF